MVINIIPSLLTCNEMGELMFLRYAKTQSDNSTRTFYTALGMFFASVIYFAVTAWAIWSPRAVNVNCPIDLSRLPRIIHTASPNPITQPKTGACRHANKCGQEYREKHCIEFVEN